MHRLTIFHGGLVRTVALHDSILTLGSAPDNDIVLPAPEIPPLALRLTLSESGYNVDCVSPRSKPAHNGRRADRFPMAAGDLLELGPVRMLLSSDSPAAGAAPGPAKGGLPAFSRLCALVAEERNLAALLSKVMGLLLETLGGNEALLFTLDGAGKPAVAVTTRPGGADPLFSDTVVKKVLKTGKGVFLANALADPDYARSKSAIELGLRSVLCCPILAAGRLSGLIYIGSNLPTLSFGEEALRELEVYALVVGCLINHIGYIEMQSRVLTSLSPDGGGPGFIASSPRMQAVLKEARAVATVDMAVLLEGETGTGKDVLAHYIHQSGRRASRPFLVVNCSTLRGELLASELFGHKKGAFTGAAQDQKGLFVAADGGTLFLDEIGEMDLPLQAMILRTLESGMVRPVGQTSEIRVDVRILCATNRKLEAMVAEGTFRRDLYYRVNQHGIVLPPLRERGGDILLLAHFFLEKAKTLYPEKLLTGFHPDSLFALGRYRWPGNIRELGNVVMKAALFADSPIVKAALPQNADRWMDMEEATRRFQMDYLQRALELCGGDKDRAAELLGMGRSTFFRYLAQAREETGANA